MLNRTFEWFRIVDPNPGDAHLENRSKSVEAFLAKLVAGTSNEEIVEAVAIVVNGANARTALTDGIIEAIKVNQHAFPSDLEECRVEVRVFAGLAIEALLSSTDAAAWRKRLAAASILETGLSLRQSQAQTHLEKEIANLLEKARSGIANLSRTQHQRKKTLPAFIQTALKAETPVDINLIENLRKDFFSCVHQLQEEAKLDQEELNILWWLYSGYSTTSETKIADLEVGAAAYCCGFEVASIALAPPIGGLFEVISRAVETGRKPIDLKATKLSKIVKSWKAPVRLELLYVDPAVDILVKKFPMLFPISSLGERIDTNGIASDWETHFAATTGVMADIELTPSALAHQIFRERTAQRFFVS
jgi:hypothetical protein